MTPRPATLLALAALTALTNPAAARAYFPAPPSSTARPSPTLVAAQENTISVEGAFARASIGRAKTGVAYFMVRNPTDRTDRLIGVKMDVAGRAGLHTHLHENGVMRMRSVKAIAIPAHGMAALKPGGDHVMFMGLKAPFKQGESFPLTLIFEHAGEIPVMVRIGPVGARNAGHATHKN